MKDYTTRPNYQRLTKNLIIFAGANRIFALKIFRNSPSQMFYKIGLLKNFKEFSGKHLFWSLFNAVAGLRSATPLKSDSNRGVFLRILWKFKNAFFMELLRIGNFPGKHLYRSPVPVTLRIQCLVTLLKWISTKSIFKRIFDLVVSGQIINIKLWDSLSLKQRLFISLVSFCALPFLNMINMSW